MNLWAAIAIGAVVLAGGSVAIGFGAHRQAEGEAEKAYASMVGQSRAATAHFDPQQIAGLPEVARRYFRHAIAPGTRSIRLSNSTWRAPSCSATGPGSRPTACPRAKP